MSHGRIRRRGFWKGHNTSGSESPAEVLTLDIREVNAAAGTRGPTDRWAFRCFTGASSDVILGHGWAARGYSAADIDPVAMRRPVVDRRRRHASADAGGVPHR